MIRKSLIGAIKYGAATAVLVFVVSMLVFNVLPVFAAPEAGSPLFVEIINESISNNSQYAPLTNYGFEINITNTTENSPGNCTFTANLTGTFANYTTASTIAVTEMIDATSNMTNCYINFTQEQIDGVGLFYYEWFVNGTADGAWNQTSNITYSIAQNTSTLDWMVLVINGTEANLTKQYAPSAINVTAAYSEDVFAGQVINFNFYRNTTTNFTALGLNNDTDTYGVTSYYYDYNTSGNTNYSVAAKHYHFNITQNTSTLSWMNLTIDGASANLTRQYAPQNINATANYSTTIFSGQTINFNFYRNSTTNLTASGLNNDTATYGVTSYYYDYNTSGNTNYSAASKHYHINITQNTSNPVLLYLNGGQTDLSILYGTTSNATAAATYGNSGTLKLYKDNGLLASTYEVSTFVAGTYVYKANITGNANYSDSSTVTRTLTVTSASSGDGGGGSTSTSVYQTVSIVSIPAGETKTMTFTKNELAVTTVGITAANALSNAELRITALASLPTTITSTSNDAYKYLLFTPTRMADSDIAKVKITFKVTKSWLTSNDVDPDKVSLNRWANSQWNKLATTRLSEDSTYITYQAEATGFSYFAITAEQLAVAEETGTAEEEEQTVMEKEYGGIQVKTWFISIVIIAAIGAFAFIYFMFYRPKGYAGYKKKSPWL